MLSGSRAFSGKIHRPFLAHVFPHLAARISWRRLEAKVGIFKNKKVHKHLQLWPLGSHRRRLAVRFGTSKGSKISQIWLQYIRGISHRDPIERRKKKKDVWRKDHLYYFNRVYFLRNPRGKTYTSVGCNIPFTTVNVINWKVEPSFQ